LQHSGTERPKRVRGPPTRRRKSNKPPTAGLVHESTATRDPVQEDGGHHGVHHFRSQQSVRYQLPCRARVLLAP
jgi:hypothetical protein